MCQTCFNRTNHPHDFISKEHFNAKWIPVIRQSAFTDILGRELTDADYQTLINLDNPPTLPEFLADKLPNSPDSHCSICETHTPASMKFLPCEHSAHESCLISDFRANINKCHTCKAIIHRGLLTLRARNV